MILKIFQNTTGRQAVSGIFDNFEILRAGVIEKYHVQVMLLFFNSRSQDIFGNAQDNFVSLRLQKRTSVKIFLTR